MSSGPFLYPTGMIIPRAKAARGYAAVLSLVETGNFK